MPTTRKVSKVLVINDQNQALLLRRSKDDVYRPGDLDFPGGSVDSGESFEQAAKREVFEEGGLDFPLGKIESMYSMTVHDGEKSIIRVLSVMRVMGRPEIILSSEHDQYWWKELADVRDEFAHVFYQPALRYLMEHRLI